MAKAPKESAQAPPGLAKGGRARLVAPVIEGEVQAIKFDENTGEKRALLAWTDAEGEAHERWFAAAELEPVERKPAG